MSQENYANSISKARTILDRLLKIPEGYSSSSTTQLVEYLAEAAAALVLQEIKREADSMKFVERLPEPTDGQPLEILPSNSLREFLEQCKMYNGGFVIKSLDAEKNDGSYYIRSEHGQIEHGYIATPFRSQSIDQEEKACRQYLKTSKVT